MHGRRCANAAISSAACCGLIRVRRCTDDALFQYDSAGTTALVTPVTVVATAVLVTVVAGANTVDSLTISAFTAAQATTAAATAAPVFTVRSRRLTAGAVHGALLDILDVPVPKRSSCLKRRGLSSQQHPGNRISRRQRRHGPLPQHWTLVDGNQRAASVDAGYPWGIRRGRRKVPRVVRGLGQPSPSVLLLVLLEALLLILLPVLNIFALRQYVRSVCRSQKKVTEHHCYR